MNCEDLDYFAPLYGHGIRNIKRNTVHVVGILRCLSIFPETNASAMSYRSTVQT